MSGNATYLIWLDVSEITDDSQKLADFLRKEAGLIVSAESVYRGNGYDFIRMNLACPLEMVKDAMNRLKDGIEKYSE